MALSIFLKTIYRGEIDMDRRILKKMVLLRKIDESWDNKRDLYGVKYDEERGYFAYRNEIMSMLVL